jgi:hypothetical protein
MRYMKPACTSTVKAARTIQSGDDPATKIHPLVPDQAHINSATSAYEADE